MRSSALPQPISIRGLDDRNFVLVHTTLTLASEQGQSEMSISVGSSALASTGGSAFAQQGNVDWVAVGRSVVEVPVNILGRLSSAGIDVLTVVVGQAICSKVPLGVHGQRVLSEALGKLGWYSGFGDALWFGVGVEHIIRVLSKTSEGASLVALCATLSEANDVSTSALVLFELAKRTGSPNELSPSFDQWQALVKVCSSALCHTTLGLQIETLLRLGEYTHSATLSRAVGHPEDMAEIILALGEVGAGKLHNISIQGGPACAWIAAYAYYVLGLRVVVKTMEDGILACNMDISTQDPQVTIVFDREAFGGSANHITLMGRTYYLRNGEAFIRNHLVVEGNTFADFAQKDLFSSGRVNWETLISETFGEDGQDLIQDVEPHVGQDQEDRGVFTDRTLGEVTSVSQAFIRFFTAGAAFYTIMTPESLRYTDIHDFLSLSFRLLPELKPLEKPLRSSADGFPKSPKHICKEYHLVKNILSQRCLCRSCDQWLFKHHKSRRYCLLRIAMTCLVLVYLIGRLSMSVPILPKRQGILRLYNDMQDQSPYLRDSLRMKFDLIPDMNDSDLRFLFSRYMSLFSGETLSISLGTTASAISDGRLFCFIDTIRALSDSYQQASIVHIGPGSIQAGHRLHSTVYDHDHERDLIPVLKSLVSIDISNVGRELQQDTTSPALQITCAVRDTQHLSYWYYLTPHRSFHEGRISVSPGSFLRILTESTMSNLKLRLRCTELDADTWDETQHENESVDLGEMSSHDTFPPRESTEKQGYGLLSIHGEGQLQISSAFDRIVHLRPHWNNILGRCAALATSKPPVTLLNGVDDIKLLVEHLKRQKYDLRFKGPWTVIS